MIAQAQVVRAFPSVRIEPAAGGLPVEVSLIAQLGHGAGNHLFASVASRQRHHDAFIDELDEPSARLGATDFAKGDATALYSFVVGPKGHPFHRHAGHRIFTAVSGSGGAQLRFSTATPEDMARDPHSFLRALRFVNIPPDCLFTVRFGGETWHQFYPLSRRTLHPVFFALSCHTNELGGNLPPEVRARVLADDADIPSLTELLAPEVAKLLTAENFSKYAVPVTTLSLDAPDGTLHRLICNTVRGGAGMARGAWATWRDASGFLTRSHNVQALDAVPEHALLRAHLADGRRIDHDDMFVLRAALPARAQMTAERLLAEILEGFLMNPPQGVTGLMALRNMLVTPLGLRTSPLGCPASSLLSPDTGRLFAGRYPVLDQRVDREGARAEVVLGADDKHLSFRSCVSVELAQDGYADIALGTRVACKNLFGRLYMGAIDYTHRRYIAPAMLAAAADYGLAGRD
jgi:hypothetical protein